MEWSKRIYESLEIEPGTEILDIGCGTGTLVDFRFGHVDPEHYVGIDPGRGMLGVFADKHPEFRNCLIRTVFEDYWPKPKQTFDLVLALFGVPSYIGEPELVPRKVQWLLKLGGTAVLVYCRGQPGETDFYRHLGMEVPRSYSERVSDDIWTTREDRDPAWLKVLAASLDGTSGAPRDRSEQRRHVKRSNCKVPNGR